jgi:mRNA-degrading endonuclease RelE of RelBE toxin-antitoxin system
LVTFNYTEEFRRQAKRLAKRYRSLADDIDALQNELMKNPEAGVSLGGGKRKIRLGVQSKGRGKRSGLFYKSREIRLGHCFTLILDSNSSPRQ